MFKYRFQLKSQTCKSNATKFSYRSFEFRIFLLFLKLIQKEKPGFEFQIENNVLIHIEYITMENGAIFCLYCESFRR